MAIVKDINLLKTINYLVSKNLDLDTILKTIFLIEWKYVLANNKRLFKADWIDVDGKDILEIDKIKDFKISSELLTYIDFIFEKHERFGLSRFNLLYSSTYPVLLNSKNKCLANLLKLRKLYLSTLTKEESKHILPLSKTNI